MTNEIRNIASHSGSGMIPSAPWIRSTRACWRSAFWSIHRSYADCSAAVCGSAALRVWNISAPHGLMSESSEPAAMASHSGPTTERA